MKDFCTNSGGAFTLVTSSRHDLGLAGQATAAAAAAAQKCSRQRKDTFKVCRV